MSSRQSGRKFRWVCTSGVTLLILSGCSSTSDEAEATQQALAEQLVEAAQTAGVAPRLTVGVAESLYGTDAPAVCDVFEGGLTTSAKNIILGNPGHGRRKTITQNAVAYGRLVVETYCPDVLDDYNEVVDQLDPFETTSS